MNFILLRGLGREKKHWLEVPAQLKKKNNHVLCLDLPGFGDQRTEKPPLTISAHTDFLRQQFLEMRPVKEPWCLVGMSLGGMIALDWTKRFPNDMSHCVLINPSARNLSPLLQRFTVYGAYRAMRAGLSKSERERELELLKMISNLKAEDEKTIKLMLQIRKKSPPSLLNISRQLAAASRFDCPNSIPVQTLVLASLKDRMVDVRCSKAISEVLKTKIKFHPTAGHDLPLDAPDWVVEQIQDFVS